jgi:hypothetical protein
MTSFDDDLIRQYDRDVIDFVTRGSKAADEARFNKLALRAFELQYRKDGEYRRQCLSMHASPETIRNWQEIPAVASFASRKTVEKLEGFPPAGGIMELRRKRGPVFPDSAINALASSANDILVKTCVFPDIDAMKMLFMAPTPAMAPGMVMAGGLERIRKRFGSEDSRFLISFRGLDLRGLISALRQCEKISQPLALLGATWAFDYFFDSCKKEEIRFRLPAGSRIVDSGGYVGRYTRCTPQEFFGKCRDVLGLDEEYCINALWLCESSTVYFDNVLGNSLSGVRRERCKEAPPWCRTTVVDPLSFKRVPKEKVGLLRHYDLTNRAMAIAVQTGNLGYETEDGFEVIGKWNQDMKNPDIDRLPSHPGGKIVSSLMDAFMGWKFSKTGRLYSSLKSG